MSTTVKNREDSFKSKLSYGFADMYGGGCFLVVSILFMVFLTNVAGLPGWLAGIIPLVGKIWDAVTDPIMGNIVDRTQSRFGKKRFWILVGLGFAVVTFITLWIVVPASSSVAGSFIFYLAMYLLLSTAFTIVMVPYNALLPDMVEDYSKRSSFTAIRMVFSALAAIMAGVLPNIMLGWFKGFGNYGYLMVSIVFAIIFGISILITFLGTWEKETPPLRIPLRSTFSESLAVYKNRSFRRYLGIFLFGQGSSDFVTTLAIYFIVVVLHPGAAAYNNNYLFIMGAILISQLVAMVLFNIIAAKTSKKFPIYLGFPIRIVATAALCVTLFFNVNIWVVVGLSFVAGLGTAASSISSYAILADAGDIDELITGKRRTGVVSSMSTFTRKVATGLASAICGWIVTLSGYDAIVEKIKVGYVVTDAEPTIDYAIRNWFMNNANTTEAITSKQVIGWCYIIIPIVFMLLCLLFTWLYKANKKEIAIVQREISRRKGEDESETTEEEKKVLEEVTGFKYENLWKEENAHLFSKKAR
ncbi:MAG: MFS transporter [Bacilli bacterium]|nr:MFS transporter [Bacilli bacterium]